jgi:hypothetical protein
MNGTDVCILISACDINFEIANAAEEVVGIDIPLSWSSTYTSGVITPRPTKLDAPKDCRELNRLYVVGNLKRIVLFGSQQKSAIHHL